ncbi:hypothetical protein [Georgenia sp. MJ170]|uniref:hypothetical protein n=1 Tax=Georgenia sunbinii TaxID=3117728 RepID=UPI002F26C474
MLTTGASARRERPNILARRLLALAVMALVALAAWVIVDPPAGVDGRALVALVLGGAWLAGLATIERNQT